MASNKVNPSTSTTCLSPFLQAGTHKVHVPTVIEYSQTEQKCHRFFPKPPIRSANVCHTGAPARAQASHHSLAFWNSFSHGEGPFASSPASLGA
jgi:hypothetical protein